MRYYYDVNQVLVDTEEDDRASLLGKSSPESIIIPGMIDLYEVVKLTSDGYDETHDSPRVTMTMVQGDEIIVLHNYVDLRNLLVTINKEKWMPRDPLTGDVIRPAEDAPVSRPAGRNPNRPIESYNQIEKVLPGAIKMNDAEILERLMGKLEAGDTITRSGLQHGSSVKILWVIVNHMLPGREVEHTDLIHALALYIDQFHA